MTVDWILVQNVCNYFSYDDWLTILPITFFFSDPDMRDYNIFYC